MVTYVVPTAPGQSRLYFGLTKPQEGAPLAMRLALSLLSHPWLLWRGHLSQNNVLDGDNVFLHMQVWWSGCIWISLMQLLCHRHDHRHDV